MIAPDKRKDMTQITVSCKISKHLNEALKRVYRKLGYENLKAFYEYAIEECIATELNIRRY